MPSPTSPDVDAYIADHPPVVRRRLKEIRAAVRAGAPAAEESISYRIPAYKLKGMLAYFAAHSSHIGFYPVTKVLRDELGEALAPHLTKAAKSTARFALDAPIPKALVTRMVKSRVRENEARDAVRKAKKKARGGR